MPRKSPRFQSEPLEESSADQYTTADSHPSPLITTPTTQATHATQATQALVLQRGDDVGLHYMNSGTCLSHCEAAAQKYISNCEAFGIAIDPGVVISLRTGYGYLLIHLLI